MDMQPRGEDLSRTQVPFRRRLARRHRPRRGIGNGPALRRSAWGLRRRGTRGATAKTGTSGRSDHQMEKEKGMKWIQLTGRYNVEDNMFCRNETWVEFPGNPTPPHSTCTRKPSIMIQETQLLSPSTGDISTGV